MRKSSKREFSVIVERDEDGYYVASVRELPGCHTQARSLDKLIERIPRGHRIVLGSRARAFDDYRIHRSAACYGLSMPRLPRLLTDWQTRWSSRRAALRR